MFSLVNVLYNFVKESIDTPDRPFQLYTTPPLQILKDMNETFWSHKLTPASMVYFKWTDSKGTYFYFSFFNGCTVTLTFASFSVDSGPTIYLNKERLNILEPFPLPPKPDTPFLSADSSSSNSISAAREESEVSLEGSGMSSNHGGFSAAGGRGSGDHSGGGGGVKEKKVPKWFKIGKK
jgi:uncharacterized membrane protein YgcG